jgi:hypothetical protein
MGTPLDFDPLSEWLEIPESERPPTHYSLLGLTYLETDHDCIQEAYLSRYQAVRRYEVGPRQEAAVQLLEDLSRAFLILSNPNRKRAYDKTLPNSAQTVAIKAIETTDVLAEAPVLGVLETSAETACPNPQCRAPFKLQKEWAGAQANCKTCGAEFIIGADLTPVLLSGDTDVSSVATSVETACPNPRCQAPFLLQREWVGARANCKTCGVEFLIGDDFSLSLPENGLSSAADIRPAERTPREWDSLDEIQLLDELAKLQEDVRRYVLDGPMERLPDLQILKDTRSKHDRLASDVIDLEEQADHLRLRHEELLRMLGELASHSDVLAQQSRKLEATHEKLGQTAYQAFVAGALPDQPLLADRKACGFRLARLQDDQKRLATSGWSAHKAKGQALLAINRGELQRERSIARSLEAKIGRDLIETNTIDSVRCSHTQSIIAEIRQLQSQISQAARAVTRLQAQLEAKDHIVPPSMELAEVLSVGRFETDLSECKQQIQAKRLQLPTLRSSFPDQLIASVEAAGLRGDADLSRLLCDLRAVQEWLEKKSGKHVSQNAR